MLTTDYNRFPLNKYNEKKSDYMYLYNVNDLTLILDNLPSKYLNNYSEWSIITNCLKSENLYDIWNQWSIKGDNYDLHNNQKIWEQLIPCVDIYYLIIISQKESIDIDYNIIKKTKKINFLTIEPNYLINKQYIDMMYFNNKKTQIVKSGCGTGKTSISSLYINNLINITGNKVISLTGRVSLAYQQFKTFKDNKLNMDIYKELTKDQINNSEKLIIQIDSLLNLDIDYWKNSIIYIDEIVSLFTYILTSTTLTGKRTMIFMFLLKLLQQASNILCTDADINDMILCYFDKLGIKYNLIENTYKVISDIHATEYSDKEILIKSMELLLSDDKKIICCFDSKQELETVVLRLKNYCKDNKLDKQLKNFLIYSSDEGDDKDFLEINDKWKSKNIFYTPKITFGVSFENKISRDIFLIARGNSINAFGYVQQISRCRNIKSLHYYVADKYCELKYQSVEDVKSHYSILLKDFEKLYRDGMAIEAETNYLNTQVPDCVKIKDLFESQCLQMNIITGQWTVSDNPYNELFFNHEYYDNVIRSAPREQFRWLLESKGFTINYNTDNTLRLLAEQSSDNTNTTMYHVLYSKPQSLTDTEKIIYGFAKNRSKYLDINFNNKVEKKKAQEFLICDKLFTQHYVYRLLVDPNIMIDKIDYKELKDKYNILKGKSLLTKVGLIKQLELCLNFTLNDINNKKNIDRFDEKINISSNLKDKIFHIFRVSKSTDNILQFKYWYYQLIHMYKHVLEPNLFISVICKIQQINYYSYSLNNIIIDKHKKLINIP
jgi:hypothetical protein